MAEVSDKTLHKQLREQEREAARLCLEAGQIWTSADHAAQVSDPDLRREFDLIARKRGEIEQLRRSIDEIRQTVAALAEGDRRLRLLRRELRRAIHENRRYHKALGQAGYRAFQAAFPENSGDWERWRHLFSEVIQAEEELDDLLHDAAYLKAQMTRQHAAMRVKTWLSLVWRRMSLRVHRWRLGFAYKLAGARIIEFHFASVVQDPEMEDILSLLDQGDSSAQRVRGEIAAVKEQRARHEAALTTREVIGAGDRGRIAVLESECRRLESDIENVQREVGQIGFMKGLNDGPNIPELAMTYRRLAEVHQAMRPAKSRLGYAPDPAMGQFRGQRVDLGPTGVARPPTEEELEDAEHAAGRAPGAFPLQPGSALHGPAPKSAAPGPQSSSSLPSSETDDDGDLTPEDVTISPSDDLDPGSLREDPPDWTFDDPRFARGKEPDEHAP